MLLEEMCGLKHYKCSIEKSETGEQEYTGGTDECGPLEEYL